MRLPTLACAALLALGTTACGAALADLRRAEAEYEDARYEAAREWLLDIEGPSMGFDREDRTRYFYTRGMTEYRLGHRAQALYYLAMARETAGDDDEGLFEDHGEILDRTLAELRPTGMMTHHPPEPATTPSPD